MFRDFPALKSYPCLGLLCKKVTRLSGTYVSTPPGYPFILICEWMTKNLPKSIIFKERYNYIPGNILYIVIKYSLKDKNELITISSCIKYLSPNTKLWTRQALVIWCGCIDCGTEIMRPVNLRWLGVRLGGFEHSSACLSRFLTHQNVCYSP